MTIKIKQIKQIVVESGEFLADARVAWWRTGPGFTVTQQKTNPQYILIRPRSSDSDASKIIDLLQERGVKFGYNHGVVFINPHQ